MRIASQHPPYISLAFPLWRCRRCSQLLVLMLTHCEVGAAAQGDNTRQLLAGRRHWGGASAARRHESAVLFHCSLAWLVLRCLDSLLTTVVRASISLKFHRAPPPKPLGIARGGSHPGPPRGHPNMAPLHTHMLIHACTPRTNPLISWTSQRTLGTCMDEASPRKPASCVAGVWFCDQPFKPSQTVEL